jgi:hypothetical protein
MIIGIAFLMFRVPAAIKLTIMEVVDEDDWTIVVASNPVEKPTNGWAVFCMSMFAKPLPRSWNPLDKSSILKKKK